MAPGAVRDAWLVVNGTNLSDHVEQLRTVIERERIDVTPLASKYRALIPGVKHAVVAARFYQDCSPSKVHQTLQPLIGSGTPFFVRARPKSTDVDPTNPELAFMALLFGYPNEFRINEVEMVDAVFASVVDETLQAGSFIPDAPAAYPDLGYPDA